MLVLSCRPREEIQVGDSLVIIARIGKEGLIDLCVTGPASGKLSISPGRHSPSTLLTSANDDVRLDPLQGQARSPIAKRFLESRTCVFQGHTLFRAANNAIGCPAPDDWCGENVLESLRARHF